MQTFLQSAFLQGLGYAIANSLWQVALLWLIVIMIKNIGRLSSSSKYFIAVIAEFAAFVWFLSTFQYYYVKCSEVLSQVSSSAPLNDSTYVFEPVINNFSSAVLYYSIKAEQLLPYLSVAYLCILLFLVVRLSRAFYFTQKIRTTGLQKADVEWKLFVKRTAAYLGIKKEVKIYFSNIIKSPVTLGFLKPLILVPVASINHLTTDQLEALLLHELAHIKRADYLINILQSIIEIVLFFNPFVQLLGKLIKKERENSCDDWVLQFQYNPAMYAEALLRIACISSSSNFAMCAAGNKNDLLSRVKRMLNKKEKSYSYRNQVFALLLITIMLTTVAWFNPATKKYNSTANKTSEATHKVVVEPLSASVDNPLFNPIYFFSKPELEKAMDVANAKISETAPVIEKAASNILASVTPIALEKLQNLSVDLNGALAETKEALNNIDRAKLQPAKAPSLAFDSATIVDAAKNVLLSTLNTSEWKEVGIDIQKAQEQILAFSKDKTWSNAASAQVSDAVKSTAEQLSKLKIDNNLTLIFQNALDAIGNKVKENIDVRKIEESERRIEERIKESSKRKEQRWQNRIITPPSPKEMKTYSDIQDENTFVEPTVTLGNNYSVQANIPENIYTPANFTDFDYNYIDSINTLDSALIIIKHNPANDSCHTKHITVEITGNNGLHKCYEFTVQVYQ